MYKRVNNYPTHTGHFRCGECRSWHDSDAHMLVYQLFGRIVRFCDEGHRAAYFARHVVLMWNGREACAELARQTG